MTRPRSYNELTAAQREAFDKNGNEIHLRNSDGFERWSEYDENNNLIHYRNNDGIEENY